MATIQEAAGSLTPLDFEPFGIEFRQDPARFHPALLAASPGAMTVEGVPSAFVASYAHCNAVLRDFKSFSSLKPKGMPGMERVDFFNGLPVMNYSDPPDHMRRRKVVNPAFTPKRTEALNEAATQLIDELLDEAAALGEFDAVPQITRKLSNGVLMTQFMGIPAEDQGIFRRYSQSISLLDQMRPGDPKPPEYLAAWAEGAAYCRRIREQPSDENDGNLIRVIANSAEGGAISEDEMMAMMMVLLIGGNSTVSSVSAVALKHLALNPDIAERIRQDPSLASRHLEESLRIDPPVLLVMRFAAVDADIGGKTIAKGMPVYTMIGTACFDPAVFPDPYRFYIDRPNGKDHMAFGQGIHTCLGNAITRNVVPKLIQAAAEKMPRLKIADRSDAIGYETRTARARHLDRLLLAA